MSQPASSSPLLNEQENPHVPAAGYIRWIICGLLFFATTINYIDRQVIGVLKTTLSAEFKWNEIDYSNIVFSFQLAYAIGLVSVGWFLDKVGVRFGYFIAVLLWSIAAAAHGLVEYLPMDSALARNATIVSLGGLSVVGFCFMRFALGIGEAGNFPAAIKSVAEWFPKKERAFATGIFNAGSNVGALLTPWLVPIIVKHWGWPPAFYITGGIGVFWLIAWIWLYRSPEKHPHLSEAERRYILSDREPPQKKLPWVSLLGHKQVWAFAMAKFMTDPIWWFYLFWIPGFLASKYGLNITQFGPPLIVIYLIADVGSIGGGWLSSSLIKRGWSVNAGRKTAMLVCAICVLPVVLTAWISNLWLAVLIIGIAAAAHQGWSANLFTTVSDTAPKNAVSSITGLGGTAGAIGGMIVAKVVGYILEATHSYAIPFVIAGSAYLVCLLFLHLMLPHLEPMKLEQNNNEPSAT